MELCSLKESEQHKILIRNPFPFDKSKNKDLSPQTTHNIYLFTCMLHEEKITSACTLTYHFI